MKKLFLILFLLLNLSNISYSDDLSEIVKKLDKIDKRLSDIEEKMKTVKESFHVDTFSVRYLHLHVYSDEWRTIAYDKMEEESKQVGKVKNVPLDAVITEKGIDYFKNFK